MADSKRLGTACDSQPAAARDILADLSIKATTRQRTRLRIQTVNDAGWPHARLSIPTDEIVVHLTLSLTELEYAVAAMVDARDALTALYEPSALRVVS